MSFFFTQGEGQDPVVEEEDGDKGEDPEVAEDRDEGEELAAAEDEGVDTQLPFHGKWWTQLPMSLPRP